MIDVLAEADPSTYIAAMRKIPAAVAVVTASHNGQRAGLTVTAICSATAEPPQVLCCVNKSGRAHAAIAGAGRFGVSFLSSAQCDVAQRFADPRVAPEDKFETGHWDDHGNAVPLLHDALVAFDCELVQSLDCATHTIYIGRVTGINGQNAPSLMYKSGAFLHA